MKKLVFTYMVLGGLLLSSGALVAQDYYGGEEDVSFETVLRQVGTTVEVPPDQYNVQAKKEIKIEKALLNFMETDFMKYFKHTRLQMEGSVQSFKALEMNYSPKDVTAVRTAYTQVAERYNKLLEEIKLDFLDKQKLKRVISKYPDMYANGINGKLKELDAYASEVFYRKRAEVTGEEIDGAISILLIIEVVNVAAKLTNYLAQMNYNARKVSKEYMDQYFMEPNRFKAWDEIIASGGNTYGNDDPYSNSGYGDQEYYEESYEGIDMDTEETYVEEEIVPVGTDSTLFLKNPFAKPTVDSTKTTKPKKKKDNH